MKREWLIVLGAASVLIALAGCSSAPERTLSREPVPYASLPNGRDPLDPQRLVVMDDPSTKAARSGVIPALESLRGHALNIVELSGGGQYGAFGAGFLKGWREAGNRPEFDIVTGVSTGALLATHAFLGTPEDDAVLEEIFTRITASDIYKKQSLLGLLWGRNAYYDTSPLQALLDKYITAEVLQRVATAYDQHRRLWVGTTNLDYGQTWVWNMGLIAKEGTPEALKLYKQVLRASAAPPIAFPPVEIAGYLFADGGVRQNLVVVGLAGSEKPQPPKYGPGTVYVIHNGQEKKTPYAMPNDAVHLAGPVLGTMLDNSTYFLLARAYAAARLRGYDFKLTAIPDEADVGDDMLAFDPEQMQSSFDAGYALGRSEDPWKGRPPVQEDLPNWIFSNPTRP